MASKTFDYLIIGNSAGGIGCVEGIRRDDRKGSIAIVSEEPHHAYSRPLITHLLSGHVPRERMDFRPRDFYRENGTEPFLGWRAVRFDPVEKTVRIDPVDGGRGRNIGYGKLLIATGAGPFLPPLEGLELDGVTPMMNLDQSLSVSKGLKGVRRAVVLGAGLIGTKTAEALAGRLEKVTLVELGDRILAPVTDPVSSRMAMEAFEKGNVDVVLDNTVEGISPDPAGRVSGVTLKDGAFLPCELLVMATGVRPRLDLLEGTGIRVAGPEAGGGVDVDLRMETGLKGVFACGDCASAHDFVTGGMKLLPLWPNAYIGGRIAGLNMAGSGRSHTWATNMNSVDFFGLPLVSAGFVVKPGEKGFEEQIREEKGAYAKVILKDDVIRGFIMAGNVERAGLFLGLMRSGVKATAFKGELLSDDFSAARLDDEVRREIMQPIREIG